MTTNSSSVHVIGHASSKVTVSPAAKRSGGWSLFLRGIANVINSLSKKTDNYKRIKSSNFRQERYPGMSTPAPAVDKNVAEEIERNKREMLDALINQQGVAIVTADDSLERAAASSDADAFNRAFETKASNLAGFRASFLTADK